MSKKTGYVSITEAGVTASVLMADQTNRDWPGVKVVLVVTAFGSGVTATLQGKDRLSGKYFTVLAGAEVVTNTVSTLTVFPGVTPSASALSQILPETWRVKVDPTALAITVVDQGTKTFTVAGDQHLRVLAGATIRVSGSTGNDGLYTVVSSTFDTDHTDIVVTQAIPDATADGSLVSAGSYTVGCHLIP